MAASKHLRKLHPMLADAPELPRGAETLWSDFLELNASRGSTGMGPAPISLRDIEAFERVREVKLDAWEVDAILAADNAWFKARAAA